MKGQAKTIIPMLIFESISVFVKNIKLASIEIGFIRAVIGSLFLAVLISALVFAERLNVIQITGGILILGSTMRFYKD